MADDIDIDDDTFSDDEVDILDDEIDDEEVTVVTKFDARRRLEQLKEERALERLLSGDYYY